MINVSSWFVQGEAGDTGPPGFPGLEGLKGEEVSKLMNLMDEQSKYVLKMSAFTNALHQSLPAPFL